jgi:hypothetical protein
MRELTSKQIPETRIDDRESESVLTGANKEVAPGKVWLLRH